MALLLSVYVYMMKDKVVKHFEKYTLFSTLFYSVYIDDDLFIASLNSYSMFNHQLESSSKWPDLLDLVFFLWVCVDNLQNYFASLAF